LIVGNDQDHHLLWPENDNSNVQKWLLKLNVAAVIANTKGPNLQMPLGMLAFVLILEWNSRNNDMVISRQPALQNLAAKLTPTSS
jgi:hypothetical protein